MPRERLHRLRLAAMRGQVGTLRRIVNPPLATSASAPSFMPLWNCVQLPVDSAVPEILRHLQEANNLVLEAPPGAGKTTRVPAALLDLNDREVLVLEPRRLAARLAARFVAEECGERVGETVGYQVRFEDVAGPQTRLRFVTEGVLTRKLLSDATLARTGCVV